MKVRINTPVPLLIAAIFCFFFYACKKDVVPEPVENQSFIPKTWNEMVKDVALDVSKKMKSVHFRKMLKHEVSMRFDGDANILLASIVQRLPKYFAYEANRYPSTRTMSDDERLLSMYEWNIIADAAKQYPQMQIAVQPDAESWRPEEYTPSVVYLTSEYDEEGRPDINGYDPDQRPISVSTQYDPDINYVVISNNERTTIRGEEVRLTVSNCLISEIIDVMNFNPEEDAALMKPDCAGSGGGSGGGGTGGGSGGGSGHPQYVGTGHDGVLPTLIHSQPGTIVPLPPPGTFHKLDPVGTFNGTIVYRKTNRHEKMREIRCDDIDQIEGWPAGAPEIRVHVFAQNVLNPSENLQIYKEEFEPSKRKHIKDKWWNAGGVTLHFWEYVQTGTKVSFGYYEFDPVIIPNETLVAIGTLIVDLLFITSIDSTTTPNFMTIYGSISQSVATGIRSLKKKNGMSEYIGKDDVSIFSDEEHFHHSPGKTTFRINPDL